MSKAVRISSVVALTILLLVSLLALLIMVTEPGGVFDKSYMETQKALGGPHAVTQMWARFWGMIIMALVSFICIIVVARRGRGETR